MLALSAKPLLSLSVNPLLATGDGGKYSTKTYGTQINANGTIRAQASVSRIIDATATKSFVDALASLPGPGEAVHMIVGFRHSMGDVLPAIVKLSGQVIEVCHIATLTFSKDNYADWCAMLDAKAINSLRVLVSHYFSKTSSEIFDAALPALTARGAIVTAARSHAKILLCKLADGRTFTCEGSANTRSAKTVEQLAIFSDPSLYQFHKTWMDRLHETQAAAQGGK